MGQRLLLHYLKNNMRIEPFWTPPEQFFCEPDQFRGGPDHF